MQIVTNKSQKELKEHGSYQFPILVSRECLSGYETGSFFWHWHPEVELTLVTEGVIEYHVNGSVFILKRRTGNYLEMPTAFIPETWWKDRIVTIFLLHLIQDWYMGMKTALFMKNM